MNHQHAMSQLEADGGIIMVNAPEIMRRVHLLVSVLRSCQHNLRLNKAQSILISASRFGSAAERAIIILEPRTPHVAYVRTPSIHCARPYSLKHTIRKEGGPRSDRWAYSFSFCIVAEMQIDPMNSKYHVVVVFVASESERDAFTAARRAGLHHWEWRKRCKRLCGCRRAYFRWVWETWIRRWQYVWTFVRETGCFVLDF
ncbi:hypothetical protein BC830DRAFT_1143728 [Chytriomyces sp. MP71]|nr:hypothetical protein BC830DRAFT_1143728 [Chytriomyces sp. MP71]